MSGYPMIADQPLALKTMAWPDFALVDSGQGLKLEQYGSYRVIRPEPQCQWSKGLAATDWDKADAIFDPTREDEETGRWQYRRAIPESWPLSWGDVKFHGRLTAFRHLAFFPEQAANWAWLDQRVRQMGRRPRILNLFGYTGVASLVCAAAGAEVTHIDASKKAIGWARENAALSNLEKAPVRWICEDAKKYVQREFRRQALYDGIIMDPPKYGRGPAGEVWRILEDLPVLLDYCAQILTPDASFILLNGYAERLSGLSLAGMLQGVLKDRKGVIDWGELALVDHSRGRGAGLSFFARWSA